MSSGRKRLRSDEEPVENITKKPRNALWQVSEDLNLQVLVVVVSKCALIGVYSTPVLLLQTDLCATLLNALKKCRGSDSKQGDFLMRVPSRRVCPNYYDIVAQPMDLMKIQVRSSMWCNL